MKFYGNLKGKQKRGVKNALLKARRLRKEQIALVEKVFITPLKENVAFIDRTLKNEVSLEEYILHSTALTAYLFKNLKMVGWESLKAQEK